MQARVSAAASDECAGQLKHESRVMSVSHVDDNLRRHNCFAHKAIGPNNLYEVACR